MSGQLIVAGFHRSGTSLVCQLLHRAGLFLGYDLLGAVFSNPLGHFEDAEVVNLHEQILADNGLSWMVGEPFLPVVGEPRWQSMERFINRRNAEHGLWGFKDPRVCSFMMPWKLLLPEARVLLIYRHFSDSTYSLGRRQSTELLSNPAGPPHIYRCFWEEPDLALRMWLTHNDALLAFARTYPEDTLVVSLEMVQNGFPVVAAVNQRWGFGLEEVPVSEVFDPTAIERRSGKQPVSDRRLIDRIDATWQALEELSEQSERARPSRTVAKHPDRTRLPSEQRVRREREPERLRQSPDAIHEQIATRDEIIYELNRKVRNLEELQRQLNDRTEQLQKKEREVAELTKKVIKRNHRLARIRLW